MVKIVKELETGRGRLEKAIALACLLADEDNVIFVTDEVTKGEVEERLIKGTNKNNITYSYFINQNYIAKKIIAHVRKDNVDKLLNNINSNSEIYIFIQK